MISTNFDTRTELSHIVYNGLYMMREVRMQYIPCYAYFKIIRL